MSNDWTGNREYLEAEYARLLAELRLAGTDLSEASAADGHERRRDEAAATYSDLERRAGHAQGVIQRLREVQRALERLDDGTYGTCECCGQVIPAARLEVVPQATRCAVCQAATRQSRLQSQATGLRP